MASVKKTAKLSKTKQAKKVSRPKAKVSNHSAETKTKREASVRALAARTHAPAKTGRGAKSNARSAPAAASRPASPGSAKLAARKKISAARGAGQAADRGVKKETLARSGKAARPRPAPAAHKGAAPKQASARSPKPVASPTQPPARQPSAEAARTPPSGRAPQVAGKLASVAKKSTGAPHPRPQAAADSKAASKAAAAAILSLKRKSAAQNAPDGHRSPRGAITASGDPPSLVPPQEASLALSRYPDRPGSVTAERAGGGHSAASSRTGEDLAPAASQAAPKGASAPVAHSSQTSPGQTKAAPMPAAGVATSGAAHSAKPGLPARPAGPGQKLAKAASTPRPPYKLNEFVVYPAHGVGQIIAIEEQAVAGFTLELFVLSFVKDKMILKVPVTKAAAVGMRKLADAEGVKMALDILAGRARIKRTMWSRRAQEYEAKINSGDLNAIAEVVRDLYRSDTQPEQSYSERQLYEAALDRMAREIVAVLKLTETEALKTIETHLRKGPKRGKTEDTEADDRDIEEAA